MRCRVIVPPEPVLIWEDANAHLELNGDDSQRTYVESLISAAQGHIDGPDGWVGRAIGPQTIEARLDGFESVRLPYPPLISLEEIVTFDGVTTQTVDTGSYRLLDDDLLFGVGGYLPTLPAVWGADSVRVRFRAGYDGQEGRALPAPIRAAILLMVGDMFAQRETFVTGTISAAVPMSTTVDALLSPFRVYR